MLGEYTFELPKLCVEVKRDGVTGTYIATQVNVATQADITKQAYVAT